MSRKNDVSDIGKRIKKQLIEVNMAGAELADKMGISRPHLYNYFNGRTEPPLSRLREMCGILNCTLGYLLGLE